MTTLRAHRSFIRGLGMRGDSDPIVTAVTNLCALLGITTLAEGVEAEDQLRRLRAGSCGEAQGYLFSRSRPAAEIAVVCRTLTEHHDGPADLWSPAMTASHMLSREATHDGLTGLLNRRALDETIEREIRRAGQRGQPLSVVMIDIDHFKSYNDYYGHPAGDECLRVVAGTIRNCLKRSGELAARYGGEEIVVLLPGSDATDAFAIAETMRLAVHNAAIRQAPGLGGVVTFSAGVATVAPGRTSQSSQALIQIADAALYAAKAAGRDGVHA